MIHNRRDFCHDETCECFDRSYASVPKSKNIIQGEKNRDVDVRKLSKWSQTKYWHKCDRCEHIFDISPANVCHGRWCPFPPCCFNPKRLCSEETCNFCLTASYASHPSSIDFCTVMNNTHPRKILRNTYNKYWFKCQKCNHLSCNRIEHVINGHLCAYCSSRKFCNNENCTACHNNSFASLDISWMLVTKPGEKSAREIAKNNTSKRTFRCKKGHEFSARVYNVARGSRCPLCVNKSQGLVEQFLREVCALECKVEYTLKYEENNICKNFRYDIFIPSLHCMIEVDGIQHFEDSYFHSLQRSLQSEQENDNIKNSHALQKGYHMIRINQRDVWTNSINWQDQLRQNIEKMKIESPKLWFIAKDIGIYNHMMNYPNHSSSNI